MEVERETSSILVSVEMSVNLRSVFGGCWPLLTTAVMLSPTRTGAVALTLNQ